MSRYYDARVRRIVKQLEDLRLTDKTQYDEIAAALRAKLSAATGA